MTKAAFHFSRKQLLIPYALFLALFVIVPIGVILYYAFTAPTGEFTFSNFGKFFSETGYVTTLLYSVFLGVATTALCLAIGYPVAYFLANSKYNKNAILILLFVMPMWINFVLRATALRELFYMLGFRGKSGAFFKVLAGMVYDFLPFMILPLYTTMVKMDKSCIEASYDLGANGLTTFFKTVIPLSMPGVVSGVTMVFMPTMTCYVISDIFSEYTFSVLGKLIEDRYAYSAWNFASAISIILLVIIGIVMLITNKFADKETNVRGGGLW